MLSQELAAIDARLHEAKSEREQQHKDIERDIAKVYRGVMPSSVLELDHITVLDPEPLFPRMRPPWLQPADRLAPMPGNSGCGCGVGVLRTVGYPKSDRGLQATTKGGGRRHGTK
jgi:hypothetical protein